MLKLTLPYPPSAWDLYVGWGANRRLAKAYKKWREDCGYFLSKAGTVTGPFCISIALRRPSKRHDIDNRAKAVLDALQHYGVITNDNLCERLEMVWDAGLKDECVVIIQPFEQGVAA